MFGSILLDAAKVPDLGTADNLKEYGITVTLSGILIVFFMLILLVFVMIAFGAVMSRISGKPKKEKAPKQKKKNKETAVAKSEAKQENDEVIAAISAAVMMMDEEVVAAISAAVNMMYEGTGVSPIIRSIKPSVKQKRSAWASAGVINNTRPF